MKNKKSKKEYGVGAKAETMSFRESTTDKIQEQNENLFSCQILKSDFKKLIKEQVKYAWYYGDSILHSILFELEDDILTMVSTDGNRLLETKIKVQSPFGNGRGTYDSLYLGNIKFFKNMVICSDQYVDMIQLNFQKDCLQIKDFANGIEYHAPAIQGTFPPNWKTLIPNIDSDSKEYTTIGVNMQFLNELNRLSPNKRTGIVELTFKNNDPLSCLVAKCDAVEVQTRALIMPVKIRK